MRKLYKYTEVNTAAHKGIHRCSKRHSHMNTNTQLDVHTEAHTYLRIKVHTHLYTMVNTFNRVEYSQQFVSMPTGKR